MKPRTTGTRTTSSGRETAPLAGASEKWRSRRASLLLGQLVATGTYIFRLVGLLLGLLLRDGGKKCRGHVGQGRLLRRTQRAHKMWRDDDQQLVGGFLGAPAAEEMAQHRNVAQSGQLGDGFDHAIVDQA